MKLPDFSVIARHRAYEERERLHTQVRAWLNELPHNVVLEPVPTPMLKQDGAPALVVGQLRGQIAALVAEFHQIKVASAPLDDAKRQAREFVTMLGKKGRPSTITTQFGELKVGGWMDSYGPSGHDVTVRFMAWLDPDRMIAALDRELEKLPQDANALPVSERAAKLSEIEDEIALLEHREEAVIERAHRDGIVIERRYDASPAAILGVRVAKPTRARELQAAE